jgi:hypothetical protein
MHADRMLVPPSLQVPTPPPCRPADLLCGPTPEPAVVFGATGTAIATVVALAVLVLFVAWALWPRRQAWSDGTPTFRILAEQRASALARTLPSMRLIRRLRGRRAGR